MATFAIGDIQGCDRTFERLLDRIAFHPSRDELWLAGDLVNRGPGSLEVLRRVMSLGDAARVVLGNHDIKLLAVASGVARMKELDTVQAILDAPDRDELLAWVRTRPLLHRSDGFVMVHAGLFPSWTADRAELLAREAEHALQTRDLGDLLKSLRSSPVVAWDEALAGDDRIAAIFIALTKLRTCRIDGTACVEFSESPAEAPPGCMPWFDVPGRASRDVTIVCGHWSSLGLLLRDDILALDTGCVWGRSLTAVRLDDRAVFQEPAVEPARFRG